MKALIGMRQWVFMLSVVSAAVSFPVRAGFFDDLKNAAQDIAHNLKNAMPSQSSDSGSVWEEQQTAESSTENGSVEEYEHVDGGDVLRGKYDLVKLNISGEADASSARYSYVVYPVVDGVSKFDSASPDKNIAMYFYNKDSGIPMSGISGTFGKLFGSLFSGMDIAQQSRGRMSGIVQHRMNFGAYYYAERNWAGKIVSKKELPSYDDVDAIYGAFFGRSYNRECYVMDKKNVGAAAGYNMGLSGGIARVNSSEFQRVKRVLVLPPMVHTKNSVVTGFVQSATASGYRTEERRLYDKAPKELDVVLPALVKDIMDIRSYGLNGAGAGAFVDNMGAYAKTEAVAYLDKGGLHVGDKHPVSSILRLIHEKGLGGEKEDVAVALLEMEKSGWDQRLAGADEINKMIHLKVAFYSSSRKHGEFSAEPYMEYMGMGMWGGGVGEGFSSLPDVQKKEIIMDMYMDIKNAYQCEIFLNDSKVNSNREFDVTKLDNYRVKESVDLY